MTVTATLITALIAGGIAFVLGAALAKALLLQKTPAKPAEEAEKPAAAELPEDVAELREQLEQLQHDKAELAAKNNRYEERINEQVKVLANLQEDRDRLRVEHGSQKRMINTLQQTTLNKDKARQVALKQQEAHSAEVASLQQQIARLEKSNGTAPVPSSVSETDGITLREQLNDSRAQEKSLKKQLQALQEWAKPLATENTQQSELIDRLRDQVATLRSEQLHANAKLQELAGSVQPKATEQPVAATDTITVPAQTAAEPDKDPLEDTHTDMQVVDDLKKIRGIGPGVERRLNNAGVFNFAQLAELSQTQLKKIAARTKKANREKWTHEARRLQEAKRSSA